MADLAEIMAAFGQALHSAGLPATPERRTRFTQAVLAVNPRNVSQLYWAGRVTLTSCREDVTIYDNIFDQVFQGVVDYGDTDSGESQPAESKSRESGDSLKANPENEAQENNTPSMNSSSTPGEQSEDQSMDEDDPPSLLTAVSDDEFLKERNFAACSQEELDLIALLVSRLPLLPPRRPSRRSVRHHQGTRVDMRATVRHSFRTAGDPVNVIVRKRRDRPRRVVLIADVSGSMEPYARVYLHLMLGAVKALNAEAFVFATRLTRLTRFLATGKPDQAYRKVSEHTPDWSGGTRIGQALMTFLRDHGQRGVARGAVVVIVSDGWEIDDPAVVGVAMRRLSRLAHHVIWVNPRKAAEKYEPLVGGMAAALPFVDTFVSGHSYNALQEVMAAISQASHVSTPMRAIA